jgi:hypothetical protein
MYGQGPELIREVIEYWGLNWPQILFVATHGTPTTPLSAWRAKAEEEYEERQEEYEMKAQRQGWGKQSPRRPFEVSGTPVRFSKVKLVQFYRKYEQAIWDSASEFISSTEGPVENRFEALGKCLKFSKEIDSLADVAAAAGGWAIIETCQAVYSDFESNGQAEEGSSDDYAQFRDIWQPAVEHHEIHTDVGGYDESVMKRLKRG